MLIKLYDFSKDCSFFLDGIYIKPSKRFTHSVIKIPNFTGRHTLLIRKNKTESIEKCPGWLETLMFFESYGQLEYEFNNMHTLDVLFEFDIMQMGSTIVLKHVGKDITCDMDGAVLIEERKRIEVDETLEKRFYKSYWWPTIILACIFCGLFFFIAIIALLIKRIISGTIFMALVFYIGVTLRKRIKTMKKKKKAKKADKNDNLL